MDQVKQVTFDELPAPEVVSGESPDATALVERAKLGDAEAFGGLMRMYEGRIISVGIRMGLSRDDAMDACQDAFVKVFRYIASFRSGESFFKWLYRIAINAIYDHMRHADPPGVVSLEESAGAPAAFLKDRAASPAASAEATDLARKALAALDCLSRQERIVFVLRDLQEMPTSEIGRILGITQITVRRHCMSARKKLHDRLFEG